MYKHIWTMDTINTNMTQIFTSLQSTILFTSSKGFGFKQSMCDGSHVDVVVLVIRCSSIVVDLW